MSTASKIMNLVHEYGAEEFSSGRDTHSVSSSKRSGEIRDQLLFILTEFFKDRKELASHCVVVIRDYENGFPCAARLCTVCQAKLKLPESGTSPLFIHKDDCLVAKVLGEA